LLISFESVGYLFTFRLILNFRLPLVFLSQFREVKASDIDNAFSFTFDFMREQDIYIPNAHYENGLRVGKRVNLRLQVATLDNLVRDDFERVDYIGVS